MAGVVVEPRRVANSVGRRTTEFGSRRPPTRHGDQSKSGTMRSGTRVTAQASAGTLVSHCASPRRAEIPCRLGPIGHPARHLHNRDRVLDVPLRTLGQRTTVAWVVENPANRPKPTPGLEPGTPSLRALGERWSWDGKAHSGVDRLGTNGQALARKPAHGPAHQVGASNGRSARSTVTSSVCSARPRQQRGQEPGRPRRFPARCHSMRVSGLDHAGYCGGVRLGARRPRDRTRR